MRRTCSEKAVKIKILSAVLAFTLICVIPFSARANNSVNKGKTLIHFKEYESAYNYFVNLDTNGLTKEIGNQKDQILRYLKLRLYAEKNLKSIYKGKNIIFHYNSGLVEQSEIKSISKRYEQSFIRINEKLDITYDNTIHVYLYPENMELSIWESLPLLSLYNSDEVHVYYGGLNHHGHIEHEMVHIMSEHLNAFNGNRKPPVILIEGLAEYIVANPWDIYLDHWVKGFINLDLFILLTQIKNSSDFREHNQIITYEESGSFVKYLIENYGLDRFKQLYSRPSFYNVYDKSMADLEDEWIKKVKSAASLNETEFELIRYRIRLGDLYKNIDLLKKVPWIGIKTFTDQDKVFIKEILSKSPAERGNLKTGDEVISVDDINIDRKSLWRISAVLLDKKPGDNITFSVKRDGEILNKKILLGLNPRGMVN